MSGGFVQLFSVPHSAAPCARAFFTLSLPRELSCSAPTDRTFALWLLLRCDCWLGLCGRFRPRFFPLRLQPRRRGTWCGLRRLVRNSVVGWCVGRFAFDRNIIFVSNLLPNLRPFVFGHVGLGFH